MRISFIELDFHFDCVDGFCRIFEHTEHQLSIFIKPGIFEKIKHNSYVKKYNWFFCDGISRTKFFKTHIDEINDADVIFIDTIACDFGAYVKADFQCTTISRTHDAYKLLDPWRHIRIYNTPFYYWKAFSYFIREIVWKGFWYYRPRLLKKIDYFVFPSEEITEFIFSQGLISPAKVLPAFPLKAFDAQVEQPSGHEEFLRITIIGSVEKRRRNYAPVIEAFRQLTTSLKRPLILTLLGKASGNYAREVIKEFKKLESNNFKLEFFNDMVRQEDFEDIMSKTHIILSPINTDHSVEIYGEIYGKTKIAGSMFDVFRFPRIMIIPIEYNLGKDFIQLFDQYSDSLDLKEIITKYIDDRNLIIVNNHRIRDSIEKKYSASSLADNFVLTVTHALNLTNDKATSDKPF